ncbi:MAG: hypothetical protein CMJ32_07120 [Phycisphaerae bacterium]|nr:hypothetical protein [Phycisphaerae bacterium]
MRTAISIIHWLALTLWIASLTAVAATAIGVFAGLGRMEIIVPEVVDALSKDHEAMGRYVAGRIVNPMFLLGRVIELVLAPIVIITGVLLGTGRSSWTRWIRWSLMSIAAALLLWQGFVLEPGMNTALEAYWHALQQGDQTLAQKHMAVFEQGHVIAEPMMSTRWIVLMLLVGFTAIPTTGSEATNAC